MRGPPASQSAFTARSLRMYLGCPREQECSASSAGFAGAILRLLASDGGAPAPRRPAARPASGGGFGRGAEPPSEELRVALFEVRGLTRRFLGVTAVGGVDLHVEAGELVSLIGPNGSGKTTLFNCVTGYLAPDEGQVTFRGRDVTGVATHRMARLGIGRTFQLVSVFPRLSALENLLTFLQQHQEESVVARLVRAPRVRRYEAVA